MAARNKERQTQRKLFGRKVQLISHRDGGHPCEQCGMKMIRRMVMEYKDSLYCSERCAIQHNKEDYERATGKA